jgi:hypothetical protein
MIDIGHLGAAPDAIETDFDAALIRTHAGSNWAASLMKLLIMAFRQADTDRERAKALIAERLSLLRFTTPCVRSSPGRCLAPRGTPRSVRFCGCQQFNDRIGARTDCSSHDFFAVRSPDAGTQSIRGHYGAG